MTEDLEVCQHCGDPVRDDSYFCGSCGKPVRPSEHPGPARKQTVFGVMADLIPAPAAPTEPAQPAETTERTTDVGMSDPPPGLMGRTMLGMPQPSLGAPDTLRGAVALAAAAQAAKPTAKTMLGIPGAGVAAPAVAAGDAAPEPPPQPGFGGRTMLGTPGLVPVPSGSPSAEQPVSPEAVTVRKAEPARTMLGLEDSAQTVDAALEAARASAPSRPSGLARAVTPVRGSSPSRASAPSVPGMRRGASRATLALAMISLLAALVLGALALRSHGPDVRVRVVTGADGESMLFEVPGAAAGAKLRFGGQEKPLQAGRASFPLASDSLRVGKNAVLYDVVGAGGQIDSGRFTLSVDSRVTLDTAPLRAGKPVVDVVVAALPGSKVWLDGQPLVLDAQGRAVRSDPLALAAASGTAEHVVKYRVEPPSGEAVVGELRASIPVTMMQIDRPGAQVVTDHDAVEIAGAVDKDARVTVGGRDVEVRAGRFLDRYALPTASEYRIEVVAMAPGKAPRSIALQVQRVESLVAAAEGFDPDRSLTYAKIASNPAIYRGQRVTLEGRVYNASVEGGKSALQVLVRQCPRGERCPLWVSYATAAEVAVDDWVRVLGVVAGEQQFRSESGEVKSVPKVEAVFLLPARP
jgi:hypothetical protein